MTTYSTVDELVTGDLGGGEDVTLPSGRVVKVRGLSRYELIMNGKGTEDAALIERRNVACAMLEPKMTVGQVEAWQRASRAGGDLRALSEVIRDLSGIAEGAQKSEVAEVSD